MQLISPIGLTRHLATLRASAHRGAPDNKICGRKLGRRVRRRDGHHLHAGGMPSLDADVGILENHRSVRAPCRDALGRLQKTSDSVSVHDIFRRDISRKAGRNSIRSSTASMFRRWVDDATAHGTPASRSR